MSFDLNAIMREVWDDTRETNPRAAAREILTRVPEDSDEALLLYLLDRAYSTFLAGVSRERPLDEAEPPVRGRPAARRRPAINPQARRDDVMRDLDERPFYVPSCGTRIRIPFKDMTAEYWDEYARYRRGRAEGYEASAQWAEMNIAKLRENNVTRSGELPDEVKKDIFAGEPMIPDE